MITTVQQAIDKFSVLNEKLTNAMNAYNNKLKEISVEDGYIRFFSSKNAMEEINSVYELSSEPADERVEMKDEFESAIENGDVEDNPHYTHYLLGHLENWGITLNDCYKFTQTIRSMITECSAYAETHNSEEVTAFIKENIETNLQAIKRQTELFDKEIEASSVIVGCDEFKVTEYQLD